MSDDTAKRMKLAYLKFCMFIGFCMTTLLTVSAVLFLAASCISVCATVYRWCLYDGSGWLVMKAVVAFVISYFYLQFVVWAIGRGIKAVGKTAT